MQELADAVACLESLGYAHGDINPRNVLVDDDDHLKLIDFDHACKIGDDLDVGYEPYVRSQRLGEPGGNYGVAGPVTEQFALGSVFWFITRRTELYADLEGPDKVDRLIDRQSPVTDPQDPVDVIIRSCWFGELPSIADLSKRIRDVSGVHSQEIMVTPDVYEKRKEECKQYYDKLACDN
jgi:serine/threonine protein kinase